MCCETVQRPRPARQQKGSWIGSRPESEIKLELGRQRRRVPDVTTVKVWDDPHDTLFLSKLYLGLGYLNGRGKDLYLGIRARKRQSSWRQLP